MVLAVKRHFSINQYICEGQSTHLLLSGRVFLLCFGVFSSKCIIIGDKDAQKTVIEKLVTKTHSLRKISTAGKLNKRGKNRIERLVFIRSGEMFWNFFFLFSMLSH